MTNIPIKLTDNAIDRIIQLTQKNKSFLRIGVDGGGCGGFQYNIAISEKMENEDLTLSKDDRIILVVDKISITMLAHAILDFKTDLSGGKFVIHNDIAHATCGCGNSFSID